MKVSAVILDAKIITQLKGKLCHEGFVFKRMRESSTWQVNKSFWEEVAFEKSCEEHVK